MTTPLLYGMVGGGRDAFIGSVHRMAAALDGHSAFVAGALSSSPDKAVASAKDLGLADDRAYPSWRDMLKGELARRPRAEGGDRIDYVSIVTPNHTHFEIALAFVEAGFHVVLDKPMVNTPDEAERLRAAVEKAGVVFAVTYNYTGYPMVRAATDIVHSGEIGEIRKLFVEYHQGWLSDKLEDTGMKQAAWRTDPTQAGVGGSVGDIGSHAEHLASTITGLEIAELCADINAFVPGRKLDDDASVLLRFNTGAKGVLTSSQICFGEENALTIRIYGTKGALAWRQEQPNTLIHTDSTGTKRHLTRGAANLGEAADEATRLPPGHPEAFIEAFANIYRGVADKIRGTGTTLADRYPTVAEGERGVRFIHRVVESSNAGGTWVRF